MNIPTYLRPGRVLFILLVAAILLYLIVPVLIVIPMSFSDARFLQFPPKAWSLRWYEAFFNSAEWMSAARTSLITAVATTLVSLPMGMAAAYAINNSTLRFVRTLQIILLLPMMVPIILIAAGVFFVYARASLISTLTGLVLAHVMLALPYVIIALLAGLRNFDMAQEMVARSLGMNRFRAFMAVTLPQIKPSVISATLFAFITSLDETVVALFISGGDNQTLPKRMFTALRDEIDPTIAAISSMLILASLLLVMLAGRQKQR
ncbi:MULTISPECIES: ABC transporter permease [unclassified Pseudomonas]|uniref:ABC transporter permease n=1 Tax=unclassified Pseudomonas TaxID=196821 RepID=UPI000BC3D2AF|nr:MULTISPECIES: ABC transporter permease [unclassified Pseudomonas]PVZ19702.1 putative spermidine/putrescine transport system permease protein [Pseudomonas sp. URIL14HWK12:I12]PVZ22713.1 putative spermidine/putrescine transport system permease protein [Pseudomonas sp. URIL14HWK12:I10]PVZ37657.1 putative spermidine/putrescine transport system permease protein [Pseudomonas sp. URIL14HWK12:I11]SNZ15410.1 putative spermidine/putrescine transport system permease protein [Pseudomonas sp. URIL14HWK12